jgi:hypothetical protein
LCKLKRKCELANEFLTLKGQIDNDIVAVDPNSTNDLAPQVTEIYGHWKSSYVIKRMKNEEYTLCLVRMIDIADILSNLLKELREEQ